MKLCNAHYRRLSAAGVNTVMRRRKRQDMIIRQYKYSVSTDLRPMPSEIWDIHRRMQHAWNALIPAFTHSELAALNQKYHDARASFLFAHEKAKETGNVPLILVAKEEYQRAKQVLNHEKRGAWLSWQKKAKETIRPFHLDYSQGPNVLERFAGCIKSGRTCSVETNDPDQPQHCQIPFVFPGSAAIPVATLYNNNRRWRIIIENYLPAMYDNNSQALRRERRLLYMELGLSKVCSVALRIDLHRPMPVDGIIKRVLLCGRKIPFRGWQWHVLFQIEQPILQTQPRTQRMVSLRICWTRWEDFIIAAQWKDDQGRSGLLTLPLSPINHQDRRTRAHQPSWSDRIYSYSDLAAFKNKELALPKRSEARNKMRAQRRRVEEQWQARRRWLYRNFASWLVQEYALVQLDDLDIKGIAENNQKKGALAGADRWRHVVAPGDLINAIKDIGQKHGRRIEVFSQTSTEFQQLIRDREDLRNQINAGNLQIFDADWNSRALAERVHTG